MSVYPWTAITISSAFHLFMSVLTDGDILEPFAAVGDGEGFLAFLDDIVDVTVAIASFIWTLISIDYGFPVAARFVIGVVLNGAIVWALLDLIGPRGMLIAAGIAGGASLFDLLVGLLGG